MTSDLLVPVVREGDGPPVFFAPSAGSTFFPLVKLARSLKNRRPFYVLDFVAMQEAVPEQTNVEDIAQSFLAEIRDVQGRGPYCLGGHCWGGTVALDVAAQLEAQGETVDILILLESLPPLRDRMSGAEGPGPGAEEKVQKAIQIMFAQIRRQLSRLPPDLAEQYEQLTWGQIRMGSHFRGRPIAAPIALLRTPTHPDVVYEDWTHFGTRGFTVWDVPGDTFSMLSSPNVEILGAELEKVLNPKIAPDRP